MHFPHGWKGNSGLYIYVGLTKRGLSGASSDALKIHKILESLETRNKTKEAACHRRCISQF